MAEVVNGILASRALRRDVGYNVVLPRSYANTRRRFAVLYLLHGLFGSCSNWIELTGLRRYADNHDLLIVMPDGGDNWYIDSRINRSDQFESCLWKDLIPRIDDLFRTRKRRESRGIAGNSMGGYGAVKLALRKPWLFAFAASTSGAFHAARLVGKPEIEDWNELMPSIEKAFGPCGSRERLVNDIFTLVSRFDVDKQVPPAIKLDCGKDDSFLGINRAFSKTLAAKGIFHSYKEYKGGHDWPYWNRRIKDILKDADDILK